MDIRKIGSDKLVAVAEYTAFTTRSGVATDTMYGYMIAGYTEYMDVSTGEIAAFYKDDLFVVPAGVCYVQKIKQGTKMLMAAASDRPPVDLTDIPESAASWLQQKIRTVRTDYTSSPSAPAANSIKPAAAVAIINDQQEVLLVQRADSGNWTLPGGTFEIGESLDRCAVREVEEETGYQIHITGIIGVYTDPQTVIAYSDGEVRQEFSVVYAGRIHGGNVQLDEESTAYAWLSLPQAENLPLAESQRRRLADVARYLANLSA